MMNKVEPELERKNKFLDKNSIDLIHKYSNDFINDLVENFESTSRKCISRTLNYLINLNIFKFSKNDDKLIFNASSFEDDLEGYENKTLYDIWIEDAQNKKLNGENIQYINTHPKDFGIFKSNLLFTS